MEPKLAFGIVARLAGSVNHVHTVIHRVIFRLYMEQAFISSWDVQYLSSISSWFLQYLSSISSWLFQYSR